MKFTQTKLKDAFIIEPEELRDNRGFFARVWCSKELEVHGLETNLAQANIAYNNSKGILRGMHYQRPPHQEVKLVRCTLGAVYDVIIDIRPQSPTFKQWIGVELSASNHRMLYVPRGFAHGYQTLTDEAELYYMVSEFYTPGAEGGIRWNDPAFNIEWPDENHRMLSEKDSSWPDFQTEEQS